jgi:hypothetical protein
MLQEELYYINVYYDVMYNKIFLFQDIDFKQKNWLTKL